MKIEQAVLGGILLAQENAMVELVREAMNTVSGEMFGDPRHRLLFEAMQLVYRQGRSIDLPQLDTVLSASGKLDAVGGLHYISTLVDYSAMPESLPSHASALVSAHTARICDEIAMKVRIAYASRKSDVDFVNAAKMLVKGISDAEDSTTSVVSFQEIVYNNAQSIIDGKPKMAPLCDTSIDGVTERIGGWTAPDVTIIGARPAMGKTAYLMREAKHIANATRRPVLFLALEMSPDALGIRSIADHTMIGRNALIKCEVPESQREAFEIGVNDAIKSAKGVYMNTDPRATIEQAASLIYKIKAVTGLDPAALIIDYLQLLSSSGRHKEREREISEISRAQVLLSRDFRIPVISASQLSRELERRDDKRPILSDLRESGSIEQDASNVIFLYRDVVYNPDTDRPDSCEIIVAKSRHSTIGRVYARFVNGAILPAAD